MTARTRLSATIEEELLVAGKDAVAAGRAKSLSAWVNDALRRQADHDRRMEALDAFIRGYEAEHGEITASEIDAAARRARERATVVRGRQASVAKPRRSSPARSRSGAA